MIKIMAPNRLSMLGDIIISLPFLSFLDSMYEDSYKCVYIDKKCSQIIPFLINHPQIDRILVSELVDRVSPGDENIFKKYDLVFDPFPQHTDNQWFNKIHISEAIFRLNYLRGSGYIDPKMFALMGDNVKPRLSKWFDVEKFEKTIAIWPFSGYYDDPSISKRSPSIEWWDVIVDGLIKKGFKVLQFGHPRSPRVSFTTDFRHLSLFDAVKMTLGCDLQIGTDSGSSWIIGAYGMRQICLYTNYVPGHVTNKDAYVPLNCKNNLISIYGDGNINNINQEEVLNLI